MTAGEFWKQKWGEEPQNDSEKLAVAMMAEYAIYCKETKLGATGQFPDGKLNENDEGEIQFGLTVKDGLLFIDFGKPVRWLGMKKQQVEILIPLLFKKLKEM